MFTTQPFKNDKVNIEKILSKVIPIINEDFENGYENPEEMFELCVALLSLISEDAEKYYHRIQGFMMAMDYESAAEQEYLEMLSNEDKKMKKENINYYEFDDNDNLLIKSKTFEKILMNY